jgi:hypothetical protein
MSGSIHSTAPDAFVQFWSFNMEKLTDKDGNAVPNNSAVMGVSEVIAQKEIISINTSKSKSSGGTFQIVLASDVNWKKAVPVGSWCFIHISDNQLTGKEGVEPYGGLKMIGIVKSVRRKETIMPEIGTRTVRYVISGEDFQSMFSAKVFISPEITEGNGQNAVTSLAVLGKLFTDTIAKSPDVIVNSLIDAILGDAGTTFDVKDTDGKVSKKKSIVSSFRAGFGIEVPQEVFKKIRGENGVLFSKMINRYIFKPLLGKISSFIPSFSDQTELWSAIHTYSNPVLNEVYTELLPANVNGKTRLMPSFIMRPVPFSMNPPKGTEASTIKFLSSVKRAKPIDPNKLGRNKAEEQRKKSTEVTQNVGNHFYVSRQIFEDEILSFDDGKSDTERLNFFLVSSTIAGSADAIIQINNAKGISNMANPASAKRHGLRPFIFTTNYDTLQQGDTTFAIMTNIVKDMYQNGHLYENGFMTIVGTPSHIPVGTNILLPERGWIAHVEAVTHEFNVEPSVGHKSYYTNIAFTRLMRTDGNPIDNSNGAVTEGKLGEWDRGVTAVPKRKGT